MIYYDENDNIIDESQVDLDHGYLTDRTYVHHDEVAEVYHYVESAPLPSGAKMKKKVIDTPFQPAWDEVTSQTYHYTGLTPEEIIAVKVEGLRRDMNDVMKLGTIKTYTISITDTTAFTFVGTLRLSNGTYELTGTADEYKATVNGNDVIGDIVVSGEAIVNVYAKANATGDFIVNVVKK